MHITGTMDAGWSSISWHHPLHMSRSDHEEHHRAHHEDHNVRWGWPGQRDRRSQRAEGPYEFDPRDHHGRRGGPRVGRGDVRAATLLLLAEQPSHGYQIIQQVSERSGGIWQPSPGSVYPALQLLEDEGLVHAEQSEGRRVFHLTDAGRTYVEAHRAELDAAWKAVTDTVDNREVEMHSLFHQLGKALRQVMSEGTSNQISAARDLLISTRRQLYRILAEEDTTTNPT